MAGRKLQYDPDVMPKLAESYAMEGFIDEQIAEKLGIGVSTLYKWQNQFSEFKEALKRGKEPVNAELKMAMVKAALGYFVDEEQTVTFLDVKTRQPKSFKKTTIKRYVPPSTTMQIFLAKNRMPEQFRDVNRYELTGKDGTPVAISSAPDLSRLSEEELRELDRILEKTEDSDAQGSSGPASPGAMCEGTD